MEKEWHFVDKFSFVLGAASFLASFIIFKHETDQLGGSLAAALMTGGLVWVTYLMLRWLFLANRS